MGFDHRSELMMDYLMSHDSIRKYASNRLMKTVHCYMRIILSLLEKNDKDYHIMFDKFDLGQFLHEVFHRQYSLLAIYIRSKIEDIHVLENYVEETNFRIKIFELILKCPNNFIKDRMIEEGFIDLISTRLLLSLIHI
eukprot:TRINITY_DN20432_c0_g1_i1.p1 TRINITY_DN20432_c0_g1~~TRINITY_DN20432_c0_g1_i1.p1  ORF type:complete len:138 (-),score=20.52 TRINITY_DN20432_c0_g1_i1:61-474(-)